MTEEERRIITAFVERISGAVPVAQAPSGPWGAAGPAQMPNLPPVDPEADRLIQDLFARLPEARYRITQTAFVQEAALVEAQNRIQQLEWEVENARREGQAATARAGSGGGMFGGLFGGRQAGPMPPPMPPRPRPQYPAGYNPQALQQAQQGRGGMGFLGTAAAAAAGVAGGMLLGNMLMGALGAGGAAQAATAADATGASSPWTDPAGAEGAGGEKAAADQGGWGQQEDAAAYDDGGSDWGSEEEI